MKEISIRDKEEAPGEKKSKRATWAGAVCSAVWVVTGTMSLRFEAISAFITRYRIGFYSLLVLAFIFFIIGIFSESSDDTDDDGLYF